MNAYRRSLHTMRTRAVVLLSRIVLAALTLIITCLLVPRDLGAQPQTAEEYQVKAAFLYNFAKFIEWPMSHAPETTGELILCVMDPARLGSALKSIEGKRVKGSVLTVIPYTGPEDLNASHILFLNSQDEDKVRLILRLAKYKSILTVGEQEHFPAWGGIINFLLVDNKVRFEINLQAAEKADLVMSSKLLKLARIYSGPVSAMGH